MSKFLQFKLAVLALLFIVAVGSWIWYFATRPAPLERVSVAPNKRRKSTPASQWRVAKAKERAAAIRSIVAQLEAFKADRYELAATYQSNALRKNFGSVESFRSAIEQTYPQFAQYKTAKFGVARTSPDGKLLEIPITLTGLDNVQVKAAYQMVLEGGAYRVSGVSGGITNRPSTPNEPTPAAPPGFEKVAPLIT